MPLKLKEVVDELLKLPQLPAGRQTINFLIASGTVLFASGTVAGVGVFITFLNHQQDMAVATRNSAVTAVSHISDMTSERRERAALVVSSVRRGAPKEEIEARKTAYDEVYVRWNSQIPGELLQIRASLNLDYGSYFQDYIDGLTDTERLRHVVPDQRDKVVVSSKPGLLSLMDSCLTQAYDAYRLTKYDDSKSAVTIIQQCQFTPMYNDLVSCVSEVSRVLYDAVTGKLGGAAQVQADKVVAVSCMPPAASIKWSELPPIRSNSPVAPAEQVTSERSNG